MTSEDLDGGDLQYHAIITYSWDKLIFGTDEPLGRFNVLKGKVEKMGYKIYEVHTCNMVKSKFYSIGVYFPFCHNIIRFHTTHG